jgi:hypothetical protein
MEYSEIRRFNFLCDTEIVWHNLNLLKPSGNFTYHKV